jgi:hypothetical protein
VERRAWSVAACVCLACCLSGCGTYKQSAWTPDGLNYTISVDHKTGALSSYVGVNWSLKP